MEDMNAPTVANKFSDMILQFEITSGEEQIVNPDSEQAFYVEDEMYISDEEFEEDDALFENFSSEEDIKVWNEIQLMKKETRQAVFMLKTSTANLCKCQIERKISFIHKQKFHLDKV